METVWLLALGFVVKLVEKGIETSINSLFTALNWFNANSLLNKLAIVCYEEKNGFINTICTMHVYAKFNCFEQITRQNTFLNLTFRFSIHFHCKYKTRFICRISIDLMQSSDYILFKDPMQHHLDYWWTQRNQNYDRYFRKRCLWSFTVFVACSSSWTKNTPQANHQLLWLEIGGLGKDISKIKENFECMVLYIFVKEDNDNNYVSVGLTIIFYDSLVRWIICW